MCFLPGSQHEPAGGGGRQGCLCTISNWGREGMKTIRIGAGAGFAGDRIRPAAELLRDGQLDYLCLECLAERTIAAAQLQKNLDPQKGYNPFLERRMNDLLPLAFRKGTKIITNMGGANVKAAVEKTAEIAKTHHLEGLKIIGVEGDDIFSKLDRYQDKPFVEQEGCLRDLNLPVAANAYIGCAPIAEALNRGADVVITGRCADPSLFLAPMVHEFQWDREDYDLLGKGTAVGHLLECCAQVSGGNFAIPGEKEAGRLWDIGFPFADVQEDGSALISKVEGTGGRIDFHTCAEQILYEIHDPSHYVTPDCIADFSGIRFVQEGPDCVRVTGAAGAPATPFLKVSIGYRDGYRGTSGISFGGHKCFERAVLAVRILEHILNRDYRTEELKIDIIGYNSLFPRDYSLGFPEGYEPLELRVRVAARAEDRETLELIANEVDSLAISGPANCGGLERNIRIQLSVLSILIPKEDVTCSFLEREIREEKSGKRNPGQHCRDRG